MNKIMEILNTHESFRVQDLIDQLSVAPSTVRRDIAMLDSMGLISRTHGEIHLSQQQKNLVLPYITRSKLHVDEKRRIAEFASTLVTPDMNLILDSGTTTAILASKLIDRKLTIATNSLDVCYISLQSDVQQIICSGGMLESDNMCFVGPEAQRFFQKIEVDIAFLGATGVRLGAGLTTSSPLQYDIKRTIISSAKHRYALIDPSKFSSVHLYVFAKFSDFDAIITTKPEAGSPEEPLLNQMINSGINNFIYVP